MQNLMYLIPVQDMADARQRLIDTWNGLLQSIVDGAIDEWHQKLEPCVDEKGGIFLISTSKVTIEYCYRDKTIIISIILPLNVTAMTMIYYLIQLPRS